MLGPVFDMVDHLLERLRDRWPKGILAVCLVPWLGVISLVVQQSVTATPDSRSTTITSALCSVVLVGFPVSLLVVARQRGIVAAGEPLWWLAIGPALLPAVVFASLPTIAKESNDLAWFGAILSFALCQSLVTAVNCMDKLAGPRATGDDSTRLRLLLQTRILNTTLVLAATIGYGVYDYLPATGSGPGLVSSCPCLFVVLVGAFWRRRALAWAAAGTLSTVFALIVLANLGDAPRLLAQFGWIVAAAVWAWVKAATVGYWPHQARPAVEPGPAT